MLKLIICLSAFNIYIFNSYASHWSVNESRYIFDKDLVWNIQQWYFSDVKTVIIHVLHSDQNYDDINQYMTNLLKSMFNANTNRTIRVLKNKVYIKQYVLTDFDLDEMPEDKIRLNEEPENGHLVLAWNECIIKQFINANKLSIIPNTRALYLILYIKSCNQNNSENVLAVIWNDYKALNVLSLQLCDCKSHTINKYDPFYYDKSLDKWGRVLNYSIETSNANKFRVFNTLNSFEGAILNVALFPRLPTAVINLPSTMAHYKCGYRDLSHGVSGLDGCVLGNLAYYLNFKINVVDSTEYGYKLPNGTYIGSLGDIVYKHADFAANSRFMTSLYMGDVEFTTPIANDVVCFIVPKPQRMPQFIMIFRCFKIETWVAIALIIVVLSICINFSWNCELKQTRNSVQSSYLNDLLTVIGISLNVTIALQARSYHHRILLATCMIFNIIIAGIFQGSLFKSFSSISYYPHINTLQQLYDSGLPISTSVNVFEDGESDILVKLKSRRVYQTEKAIIRAAFKQDLVAVERLTDARFLIQTQYISNTGVPLLHIVPQCPSSYFLAYVVQKNSPYLPRFNELLTRFLESGLISKWKIEIVNGFIIKKKYEMRLYQQIQKSFALRDVQTPFYLLIMGIILSSLTFLGEIFVNYIKIKYNHTVVSKLELKF